MGVFSANQIKFDKNYLKELTGQPGSGVFEQQSKYHIALHPAQLKDFGESIKDELSRKIGRYDQSFKGIMLGFKNIKLESDVGIIGPENCYIHLDVQASFFVFRPLIDMFLKGTVTRTTRDHVGCLIYNTFNVSLPKPENDDGTWLGANVGIQSEVEFKITHVNLFARLPHIRGEIISILNEGAGVTVSPTKLKKRKKNVKNEDNSFPETVVDQPSSVKKKSKSKKSKKTEPTDDANEALNFDEEFNMVTPKEELEIKDEFHLLDDEEKPQLDELVQKPKKEKRKHRHKTLNQDESESFQDFKVEDPPKKRKHKREGSDLEVSLESLDIKSLFADTSAEFCSKIQDSVVSSEKKSKRKRAHSVCQELRLDDIKLEDDSDLERIVKKEPIFD